MAGAAGAPLGSVLTFFLPKIWSAFWQKDKLEIAVKSLKDEHAHVLGIIQDCRLRDRDWGGTLLSIARLRRMANEIEDCIDSCHIAKTLKARADLLRKIPGLKERSKQLGELYNDKKKSVSSSSQGGSGGSGASGHAQSFSGGDLKPSCAEPVDMDGPIKELLELVKVSANETEIKQLKVISISGFGGLGKTLLADQVYFHQDVCAQFTVRARVEAAGKSHDEVLEEILEQLLRTSANDGEIQQNDEHSHGRAPQSKIPYPRNKSAKDKGKQAQIATQCVVDRLRSYLKNKRFLIVILDIQIWIDIASVLEGVGELHSRFIVTTTVQSIATKWASPKNHLYQMSTLKEVYSVELFFKEFNRGKWKNPDKGQLDSSKSLLMKCEGLPLALISTAKILSGGILDNITCSEAWKKLCAIKPDDTSTLQKMQWVLASTCAGLSGTNITPALMDCLLYFSMFPPNHHVRKNSLMRRLLAEGMEQNGAGEKNNLEELIHRLIDRCTIQSMEVSTRGDVKQCKASSLMYEYILHRSMSEEFMAVFSDVLDKGFSEDGYVRRLSIHATETGIGEAKLPDDLSHLHTLAVFDTKKPEATRNLANCLFAGKGVLTKYRVLRVLDLKECAGLDEKHLQTICKLLLLKYLSLGDSIVRVPRKIAQLKLLETLDLSRTKVVTVYIEVLGLPKLTHLLGKVRLSTRDSVSGVEKQKRFLDNKCKLDTLAGFITGTSEAFPQLIGHMRKLNKVKIWIHSTADGKNLAHLTEGIKEFVRKDRYESEAGRSLSIDFSECIEQYPNESLHFLNLQGPHTDGMQDIATIQGDAQGAQREQQEDAKQCMSTDGGSGRNQNKNMQHNNQEYQTEEGGDNAQGAQINKEDKAQQYLGSNGSSMSKQIKNMHHHTQGAQIKKEEEKAKQCLGSDAGTTNNQIHNMKDNTQESQTEEVEEIANIQSNTQEAQIERHEETKQCLCSNGDNMSKQIRNKQDKIQGVQIEKGDYIVNIQDITQGAQIHQEKEANQCLSNEGDSMSNQIKNMQENSQEEVNECLGSDGGNGSSQIKNNMQNNNQEYETEEVEEIVNMQNDTQVAEIEQEETKQCLGGSSMSKQINNMQVVGEIMNIQDNTQGAQIHQEDPKECLGSEGGSTSNQIKNMPENSQDYQRQEKEEAKQGPDYDNANSTNGTGILQDLVEIQTEHDERPSKLTSLKLAGKLPRFPVQLVTQMTGIQRLCLSSTVRKAKIESKLDLRTSVEGKVFLSSSQQDPVHGAAYVPFLHNNYEATLGFAPLERKDPLKLSNLTHRPARMILQFIFTLQRRIVQCVAGDIKLHHVVTFTISKLLMHFLSLYVLQNPNL